MKPFGDNVDVQEYIRQRKKVRTRLTGTRTKHKIVGPSRKSNTKTTFRPRADDKLDALLQAANTVDIPEKLVEDMQSLIERETTAISNIILKEGIAPLIAYRSAVAYTGVVLRDGLDHDPGAVDNDVEEVFANAVKIRTIEYLLTHVKLNQRYKQVLLTQLTASMAKTDNKNYTITDNNPRDIVGVLGAKKAKQ